MAGETPSDLKYTSDHEWVRTEGDLVRIGITDFAQTELGDVVYVAALATNSTEHEARFHVDLVQRILIQRKRGNSRRCERRCPVAERFWVGKQ